MNEQLRNSAPIMNSRKADRDLRRLGIFTSIHFVTSMTAPIASGWSDCRVGLAPTGKRRLFTAHTHNGHRLCAAVMALMQVSAPMAQADPTTLSGKATPRRCAGVVAAACTQGKRTKHGKPQSVVSDDQPEAREGQAGRLGVAERFVVPLKPGNAGGGKGPQFKTDAIRGEGPGDWATYKLR